MTLHIPDDILKAAGLTEREALVEFACRLFDAGRIDLPTGARLAGLTRPAFENELAARGMAAYRPTPDDLKEDLATIEHLDRLRRERSENRA